MRRTLPARFWFEAISAALGLALFVLTLLSREWIEALTGWDPDKGNGSMEVFISVGLLAVSAISYFAARRHYRRVALA